MEMCYDGTLVMPGSYALKGEEEMCYTEGGYFKQAFSGTGKKVYNDMVSARNAAYALLSGSTVGGHWLIL